MKFEVKLISGLLSADRDLLDQSKKILQERYGRIDAESETIPFDFTKYYDEELGSGVLRQFVSFDYMFSPEAIRRIKCEAVLLEKEKFSIAGKRKVNIDPGFVALDKMVLATTKDATYRIYLGDGIHAQVTLFFKDKTFQPWEWTYQDYKTDMAIEFFNKVREIYRAGIRGKG